MASDDTSNSSENTLGGARDVDKQKEETLGPLGELLQRFLSINIETWVQTKASFPNYNLDVCKDMDKKDVELMKSILILAYLFRRKFWKLFQATLKRLESSDETYALFRSIPDDHYMFHYLVHLACLYEIVAYSHTKKYDMDHCVKTCILNFTDEKLFFKQGGIEKLYLAAKNISGFYVLVESFGDKVPNVDILTPFAKAVNTIERRYRYADWLTLIKNKSNTEENPKYIDKVNVLIDLIFQEFRLGCISKNFSQNEDSTNISSQIKYSLIADSSSSVNLDETDLKGIEFHSLGSSNKYMDTTENKAENALICLDRGNDTALVLSKNYREKYMNSVVSEQDLNCKRYVKIFCPQVMNEVAIFPKKKLDVILDNCRKFYTYGENCVFELGCLKDFEKGAIILDTSSEEEDELDSYQESLKRNAMNCFWGFSSIQMRRMKLLIGEYTKKGDLLEFLFTEVSKKEQNEKSTGDTPKDNSLDQRKPGNSTNSNGAIPKAKSFCQRKPRSSDASAGSHSSDSRLI